MIATHQQGLACTAKREQIYFKIVQNSVLTLETSFQVVQVPASSDLHKQTMVKKF